MGKPIFALTLEEARAELLRAAPRTWRQDMLRVRMHYDERWVRRLHGWALLRVEIPDNAKHAQKSPF